MKKELFWIAIGAIGGFIAGGLVFLAVDHKKLEDEYKVYTEDARRIWEKRNQELDERDADIDEIVERKVKEGMAEFHKKQETFRAMHIYQGDYEETIQEISEDTFVNDDAYDKRVLYFVQEDETFVDPDLGAIDGFDFLLPRINGRQPGESIFIRNGVTLTDYKIEVTNLDGGDEDA